MENNLKIAALEERIGYTFQAKKYLDIALTHSSYANEVKKNLSSNERQEFLGDAVLDVYKRQSLPCAKRRKQPFNNLAVYARVIDCGRICNFIPF